jgi:hypothetical protein
VSTKPGQVHFFGMIVGPIAAAADAKLSGSRFVATATSIPLLANFLARAWPMWPKPIIASSYYFSLVSALELR